MTNAKSQDMPDRKAVSTKPFQEKQKDLNNSRLVQVEQDRSKLKKAILTA